MNPGDFCNEELDVRPAFALRDFAQLMHSHVMLFAGAPVCRPQLQRVRAPTLRSSNNFVHQMTSEHRYMAKLRQYNDTIQNVGKQFGCVSSVVCVAIVLMTCFASPFLGAAV